MTAGAAEQSQRLRDRARDRMWSPTVERTEILAALSSVIAAPEGAGDTSADDIAVLLADVLGDGIAIATLSADGESARPIATHHPEPACADGLAELLGRRIAAEAGFTGRVLDTCAGILIPRISAAECHALQPEVAPVGEAIGMKGFIIAPIRRQSSCIGLVAQIRTRDEPALCEDELRFLEEVGLRMAGCLRLL